MHLFSLMDQLTVRHIAQGLSYSQNSGLIVRTRSNSVYRLGRLFVWSEGRNEIVTSLFEAENTIRIHIFSVPNDLASILRLVWTSVNPCA